VIVTVVVVATLSCSWRESISSGCGIIERWMTHEPVIPSLDVVGNAASVAPEQIVLREVNVGVTFGLTTTVVDPARL
jgi:hypothetical protein